MNCSSKNICFGAIGISIGKINSLRNVIGKRKSASSEDVIASFIVYRVPSFDLLKVWLEFEEMVEGCCYRLCAYAFGL
jgi:hypothetical protein